MDNARSGEDVLPVEQIDRRKGEKGPRCESCGKPVRVGQVVLVWDDAGEMHVNCDDPYALTQEHGMDEPAPVILLGSPMRHVPAADVLARHSALSTVNVEALREAAAYLLQCLEGRDQPRYIEDAISGVDAALSTKEPEA